MRRLPGKQETKEVVRLLNRKWFKCHATKPK